MKTRIDLGMDLFVVLLCVGGAFFSASMFKVWADQMLDYNLRCNEMTHEFRLLIHAVLPALLALSTLLCLCGALRTLWLFTENLHKRKIHKSHAWRV